MEWNKHTRPPPSVCPQRYCFHWVPPGGAADMSGRAYDTFAEAITPREDWVKFPDGGCGCCFGKCSRIEPGPDASDWYEAETYNLKEAGLPWFYFISSLANLIEERHEEYLRESRELWGDAADSLPA